MTLKSYTPTTDREDLSDVLAVLGQRDTPLLDMFMDNSVAATNTKHEWAEVALFGFTDKLNEDLDSSETSVDVVGSFKGVSVKYLVNTVILVDDEYMQVTAVSGNTLTVTRGFLGSTAAAHANGASVTIISTPQAEAWEPSVSSHQVGARKHNFTQIFGDAVFLAGTTQSLDTPGNEVKMSTQTQRVLKKLMKSMERAIIYNKRFEDGSGDNRIMGGFEQYVPSDNVKDANGQPLSLDLIDEFVRDSLDKGGQLDCLLVSNIQKGKLNNLKVSRVEGAQSQSDKRINNLVDYLDTDAGPLKIVRSNDVAADTIWLVQKDRFKVVPLQGRRFGMEKLAKVGDLDKVMIIGEYTMEARNPEVMYKIKNLATA